MAGCSIHQQVNELAEAGVIVHRRFSSAGKEKTNQPVICSPFPVVVREEKTNDTAILAVAG
jgi:hypothetical protein